MRKELLVAATLLLLACPKPPPPAPTVAWVQPSRAGVVAVRAGSTQDLPRARRVESDTQVRTPVGVRASLFLDAGAWVLLDQSTSVTVNPRGLKLEGGRIWVDARGGDELEVTAPGDLTLAAQNAGLSVAIDSKGSAQVYCSAGQVTWKAGSQGGRLEAGLSLLWKDGAPRATAQALWDDWTYGLAEPGPLRPLEPAGVGQLSARRPDAVGVARAPLIVRQHDVRVRIQGDMAVTEIEQVFFNPRSEQLEGVYTVRLPEDAILQAFAVGTEDTPPVVGSVVLSARPGTSGFSDLSAQLEWAGPGRYRGVVRDIAAGKTKTVRVRYVEWLPHLEHAGGARRTYVYPMGQSAAAQAGGAPNLGEFSLEVDLRDSQATGLEAGLGASVDGNKVVLRKSDFRPHADFVLDLLDDPKARKAGTLQAYRGDETGGVQYLLAQPVLAPGAAPEKLDVVLVVDVSAATDEARLDLGRSAALAVLQQLGEKDRAAVVAASATPVTLGREALAPVNKARIEELSAALGKQTPAGATNLEAALVRAVELLPAGQGTVIYIGDGRPTVGALLPGELKDRLQRLGQLPRFFAVAVGSDANLDLLEALCDSGLQSGPARVVRIDDRPEAARAALYLLERAAQPSVTEVRVELGEEADVVYPEAPVALEGGAALPVVARLRKDRGAPKALTVHGVRDGKPFSETLTLEVKGVEDEGDLARRWALARLSRLLQRGAGREAVLDIGGRFSVVTPFTAVVVGGRGGDAYAPLVGDQEAGTFVPPALRGQAPTDTPLALEAGVSTASVRTASLDELYQRLLQEKEASARVCYERKAAGHPELSGRVVVRVKVALDGVIREATVTSSTLRAKDVDTCIERAIKALKLPPAPDGKPHDVDFSMQFTQPDHGDDEEGRGCSPASRAYLSVRRALWRERLGRSPGVEGAMTVWNKSEARCELRSWLDRRALLDLVRPHVGTTAYQVDLFHRFDGTDHQSEVQSYLRREILRAVRTEADVRAAQAGLMLDGGIDPGLLEQELKRTKTVAERIAVVRSFLLLSPNALALKLQLLSLLEEAGQKTEARRLIDTLRSDPGADAAVRQTIGEYLIRNSEGAEGARAFSEIVEFAPFDPWGRRRLGDLFRAFGFYDAAYREYQVLAWLVPNDDSVLLLLADAAAGLGRFDEALRLTSRLAEAVGARASDKGPAAWARALYAVRMARQRSDAKAKGNQALLEQLAARGRSDGVGGYAGKLLVAVTWSHPDAGLQLSIAAPGGAAAAPGAVPGEKDGRHGRRKTDAATTGPERATIQGGTVGIEAQRFEQTEAGDWRLVVSRTGSATGKVSGELTVIVDDGAPTEQIHRVPLTFDAGTGSRGFVLSGTQLRPE